MAKDYTKYNVEGVGSNLNKARLVQKIVEHHASSFDPSRLQTHHHKFYEHFERRG